MREARRFRFACTAALGGLLFGFDTAVISGATESIKAYFAMTDTQLGWAVSSALVGCMLGAIGIGRPGDWFGRRRMLIVTAILLFVSAIWTGAALTYPQFVLARILGGIGVGGASVMAPMYIAEISPARQRGLLVSTAQFAIVLGIVTAFFSNYLLATLVGDGSWRFMFWAEAVPATVFFAMLLLVDESPRWLVLVGMVVGMFNQLTGINAIMYYAPMIFQAAGFAQDSALLQTVAIGATNLVFTLVGMALIDRVGRKTLLMIGAGAMPICLGLFAYGYMREIPGYFLVYCAMAFVMFFCTTQGVVIWVILSEMFPNRIRARASAIASFSLWLFCSLTTFLFPVYHAVIGIGPIFLYYAVATLVSFFFFWVYLVETKGKTLEEIEQLVLGVFHDSTRPNADGAPRRATGPGADV